MLITLSTQSYADGKWCEGKIKNVWVDYSGRLYITGSWRSEHTQICNLNIEWKGVTTKVCQAWLAEAQLAFAAQSNVIMHYDDVSSCSEIPSYTSAPRPTYLMIKN
ncbi:hypothetical protein SOPP22_01465 [Shewanella sp. OPT22]|nr:hypothetical protein SOPP22_01465 [Shewanella sp. OPT22]